MYSWIICDNAIRLYAHLTSIFFQMSSNIEDPAIVQYFAANF